MIFEIGCIGRFTFQEIEMGMTCSMHRRWAIWSFGWKSYTK